MYKNPENRNGFGVFEYSLKESYIINKNHDAFLKAL